MKRLEAMIRTEDLEPVCRSLMELGHLSFYIEEPMGFARPSQSEFAGKPRDLVPRNRVTLVLDEDDVDGVVEAIRGLCASGRPGDGKIVLTDVEIV